MPIYEFCCDKCCTTYEHIMTMNEFEAIKTSGLACGGTCNGTCYPVITSPKICNRANLRIPASVKRTKVKI